MIRTTLITSICLAALVGCSSPSGLKPTAELDSGINIKQASAITIPAGEWAVYFSDGQLRGEDALANWDWVCSLELDAPAASATTLPANTYQISSRRNWDRYQDRSIVVREATLTLVPEQPTAATSMVCRSWQEATAQYPLDLAQLQRALQPALRVIP